MAFAFASCQSDTKEKVNKIEQLEQELLSNPSKENRDSLIVAYQTFIKRYPENSKTNVNYYNQIADLQLKNKAFSEAVNSLMTGIKQYPSASAALVWSLQNIYEKYIRNSLVSNIIKKLYLAKYPEAIHSAAVKEVVKNDTASIAEHILALSSSMYNENTHQVDFQTANDYIKICELYALLKPNDAKSPDYLYHAGETARAIRSFPKAIQIYNWIKEAFPQYDKLSQVLFLKAFTYDNDLENKTKAKSLYEEFLRKYPEDDFADDTQFLLENLGKDDEEIIKEFSKQQD